MSRKAQAPGKQGEETSYVTATIDEILLFLCSLKDSDRIDSRILFHFMQKPVVACEIQQQHRNWTTFACETSELDLFPFCGLDVQVTSQGEEFLMLTPRQACFLVLYAEYPHIPFLPNLKPAFDTFLQENKGRTYTDAWFVALC